MADQRQWKGPFRIRVRHAGAGADRILHGGMNREEADKVADAHAAGPHNERVTIEDEPTGQTVRQVKPAEEQPRDATEEAAGEEPYPAA